TARSSARASSRVAKSASLFTVTNRVICCTWPSDETWPLTKRQPKRLRTCGLLTNGASLGFIFGHRLSTIPRAFFLLETFFCPLSDLNSWWISRVRRQCRKSEASGRYLYRFFIRGLPQHIAATPYRFDVVLAARGVGQLLAQLAHEHVDYFLFRLIHPAVEVIEKHFLGHCHALAQAQELQHLVLPAGEMHRRAVDHDRLGVEVDGEIVDLNDGLGVTPGAAHDGVDARHQLVLVEWLGHIVIGAEAETLDLVLDAGKPGKDQGRCLHLRNAQAAQHLEA